MAYDNTNRGALWKNDKKETEKQPDYKGKLNVNGKDMYISAWLKKADDGSKYMSLSISEPMQGHQATKAQPKNDSDDIPFAPIGKYL